MRSVPGLLLLVLLAACSGGEAPPPSGPSDLRPLAPVPEAVFPAPDLDCAETFSFTRAADGAEAGLVQTDSTRSFYSYRPTESAHPNAPLLVVFNGDGAVSSIMLGGGTGPRAVVYAGEALDTPIDNPASWTRFGHLLYLDPNTHGFGYQTAGAALPETQGEEAAEIVEALLSFLTCRAPRPDLPLVLVGESRGGSRVQLMLWLARHADELDATSLVTLTWGPARRRAFADRVRAHAERLAAGRGEAAEGLLQRQFFASALIQPALPNVEEQFTLTGPLRQRLETDPERPVTGIDGDLVRRTQTAMFDRDESRALLGVDVAEIGWLASRETDEAAGALGSTYRPHFLEQPLGPLTRSRSYYGGGLGQFTPSDSNELFVQNLRETHTFVTDARFDEIVLSPALFESLTLAGRLEAFAWDEEAGEVEVTFPDGETVLVLMPTFDAAHVVAYDQPLAFADALEGWLAPILGDP